VFFRVSEIVFNLSNKVVASNNIKMTNSLGLDFFSPNEPLGQLILIIGVLFTSLIIYIFININKPSESERKRQEIENSRQQNKINSLYPNKKNDQI